MKKILILFLAGTLSLSLLAGCSSSNNNDTPLSQSSEINTTPSDTPTPSPTETPTPTPTPTPEPHTHSYTEAISKEATCTETGEKTFACDCSDAYTEEIPATGHQYSEYKSNGDAIYTADGTETATCTCGSTDTRTAKGSKLEYTYTELSATK